MAKGSVAVVGAGSWGTAVAALMAQNAPTVLWCRSAELAEAIGRDRENARYLPGIELPATLGATASLSEAVAEAELVLMAVPSHGFRAVLEQMAPDLAAGVPLVSLTKGIETGTNLRMSEVAAQVAPANPAGALSGPNLAREVAEGYPAASLVALPDETMARLVQEHLHCDTFRVYTGTDVVGCEIAGATKNVMAIAAGIADGLGFGENTRAVLVTRGLAELGRLGITMGGETLTFGGLAGVGDLVATCTSPRSRNRTVGFELGQGRSLDDVLSGMHMVAEGVRTAGPIVALARRHGVEMPIAEQVAAIVAGETSPREALAALMHRPARSEWDTVLLRVAQMTTEGEAFDGHRPAPTAADASMAERRQAALVHVRGLLLEAGATDAEIDRAVADRVLDLLAVDRLLVPATRRYSAVELAELTGQPLDLLKRLWRALGFLDAPDDDPVFTDLDIEAIRLFTSMVQLGATDVEVALQMARVIGSSMARIAEAEVVPGVFGLGEEDEDDVLAADSFASIAGVAIPAMAWVLEFVWRRHVQAATRRSVVLREGGHRPGAYPSLAVGFADMVGFTLLSQHLGANDLASVVRRFEEISHDTVTGLGGRVVKMIGDEVMFVIESVEGAARIALDLAEAYADDDLLSDVRVGLALGEVLLHEGDYYGPTVNLAHRIVNIANPGTVLMSDDFKNRLLMEAGDAFIVQPLRPRLLKGFGRVQLWWCGRPGQELAGSGAAADTRRNTRWERLAEVLRDLDELREVGERLLSGTGRFRGPSKAAEIPTSVGGQPEGGDTEGS